MKTWRETKIGNDIKQPKAEQMIGLNNKQSLVTKLKKQKEKQRKLLKIIRDEMKKSEQFKISLEGLEKLSDSSVNSIQKKREKTISNVGKSIKDLLVLIQDMQKTENQFRKTS